MKVSELANAVGVNPQTLRYYERENLLAKPSRTASGYRDYDHDALERLRFICHAKAVGFTLREIRELIGLNSDEPKSCGCVQKVVEVKLLNLEAKLKAMRQMKRLLRRLRDRCAESPPNALCPVLKHLDS